MKKIIILCSLLMVSLAFIAIDTGQNEVIGKITTSNCPKSITKGDGYNKDGTEIMHSDDPMGEPNMNIIVSLHPLDFEPELVPTKDAYMTQTEQTFIPHILPVVVGSKVHFLNEDEFFHNVQSFTPKSRFSIGRRAPGISYSVTIKKIGEVNLMCDIHSHMNAKILSFDTPYFSRVKADGTFSVPDLPDGKYLMKVFHSSCENASKEITIKGNEILEVDFHLTRRA